MPKFTLIVPELKNSNFDGSKTQLGQNSRTQIVKKSLKKKKSLNCNKTQNISFDKTQIATKLKNSNCDKHKNSNLTTQKLKFWQLNVGQNLKQSFGKNNWTPWQPMKGSRRSVLQSSDKKKLLS